MKCFYHADADGRCSGFWVHLSAGIPENPQLDGLNFIEINYGQPFPIYDIGKNEQVYIVDYSIEPDEMLQLLEITKDVTWIDHHKTAIEKYKDFPHEVRGIRVDGVAACMLTFCYLHHMTSRGFGEIKPFDISMTDDAPMFTKLIADWDVWEFKYHEETTYFHTAFETYNFSPSSRCWNMFFTKNGSEIETGGLIDEGRIMTRFRDEWAKKYCKEKGFETSIEGHKTFAMNLGMCNSEYFKSVINEYEIVMPFSYDGSAWMVSMYSTTVDVSEIAKKYGGGGHKVASGFRCANLPF